MGKKTMRQTALQAIGYELDYANETIWITKDFGRKAQLPQSKEYKKLTQMRREYEFGVAYRTVDSKPHDSYEDLTYAQMVINIGKFLHDKPDERKTMLEEMANIKKMYEGERGAYGKVKQWYVGNFKEAHRKLKLLKNQADNVEGNDKQDDVA